MNTPLRPTQIVRQAMRSFGKTTIYTNKYTACRTVKCYASDNEAANSRLIIAISKALGEANIKNTAVRRTKGAGDPSQYWCQRPSIIIQVPL